MKNASCAPLQPNIKNNRDIQLRSIVQSSEGDDLCTICDKFSVHLNFAAMSRDAYRKDGDNVKPGCVVLAVDLQKVGETTFFKITCFDPCIF